MSQDTSSGSGSGASTVSYIGAAVSTIGGIYIAAKDASDRKKIEEDLQKLSLAQQKELAEKQAAAKNDIERLNLLYQYLAIIRNNDAMAKLDKTKYTGIIVLGTGLICLAAVIILARKKYQNG